MRTLLAVAVIMLMAGCSEPIAGPDHRGGNGIQPPTESYQSDDEGNELDRRDQIGDEGNEL